MFSSSFAFILKGGLILQMEHFLTHLAYLTSPSGPQASSSSVVFRGEAWSSCLWLVPSASLPRSGDPIGRATDGNLTSRLRKTTSLGIPPTADESELRVLIRLLVERRDVVDVLVWWEKMIFLLFFPPRCHLCLKCQPLNRPATDGVARWNWF